MDSHNQKNLTFTRNSNLDPNVQEQLLEDISSGKQAEWNADGLTRKEVRAGYERKILTEHEQQIISDVLNHAAKKLNEIGISAPEQILPSLEQIYITTAPSHVVDRASGGVPGFGNGVRVNLPEGMDLDDPYVHKILFHEITHFITLRVIRSVQLKTDPDYADDEPLVISRVAGVGFSWRTPNERSGTERASIFEEPLADYFALFCLEDFQHLKGKEQFPLEISYTERMAFFFALIEDLGQRLNMNPFDIFSAIFRAKVTRDFSIFRDIVVAYGDNGIAFTRALLRVETHLFGKKNAQGELVTVDVQELFNVAELGGFEANFVNTLAQFRDGKPVQCPGLNQQMTILKR